MEMIEKSVESVLVNSKIVWFRLPEIDIRYQ